jgi:hypothetical protein
VAAQSKLHEIAAYKLSFDGTVWNRRGFLKDGTLVDSVWWKRGKVPVLPSQPAPFRADIQLLNGESRGRNGWLRAALAVARTNSLPGLPEVTVDVYGRREARMPSISLGLSRRDAEALGWALIAVATVPPAPQP